MPSFRLVVLEEILEWFQLEDHPATPSKPAHRRFARCMVDTCPEDAGGPTNTGDRAPAADTAKSTDGGQCFFPQRTPPAAGRESAGGRDGQRERIAAGEFSFRRDGFPVRANCFPFPRACLIRPSRRISIRFWLDLSHLRRKTRIFSCETANSPPQWQPPRAGNSTPTPSPGPPCSEPS